MTPVAEIRWLDEPADEDYAAAESFLSMLIPPASLDETIARLRNAPAGHWAAKDVLRAAGLPPQKPGKSDEVAEQLAKVKRDEAISPVLLVGGLRDYLVIADGYHRASAAYKVEQATPVPGRLLWLV